MDCSKFKSITWLTFLLFCDAAFPSATAEPPQLGNFSLPASQQPGPLYSFGQNVIQKNQLIFFIGPSYQRVNNGSMVQQLNSLLYGISDYNSLLIASPYAFDLQQDGSYSSGFGDTSIQFEQSIFSKSSNTYTQDATVLFGFSTPTGSAQKNPPTGGGTYSYFLGTTYNETYVYWMWFISTGMTLKGSYQDTLQHEPVFTSPGNEYLYQAGFGRNISSVPGKYELEFLIELGGTYFERTYTNGSINPLSGGNIIYATPSLWYSTPNWFLQLGCSVPVVQSWNDPSNINRYIISSSIGYTFS